MHPKSVLEAFRKKLTNSERTAWKEDIDSLGNLQLLTSTENNRKRDMSLKNWVEGLKKNKKDLFISEETSLEPEDFQEFIKNRRENMKTKLIEIIESLSK